MKVTMPVLNHRVPNLRLEAMEGMEDRIELVVFGCFEPENAIDVGFKIHKSIAMVVPSRYEAK